MESIGIIFHHYTNINFIHMSHEESNYIDFSFQ